MAKLEIPSPAMSSDGDMERDDEYEHAGFDQDVEMNYEGECVGYRSPKFLSVFWSSDLATSLVG